MNARANAAVSRSSLGGQYTRVEAVGTQLCDAPRRRLLKLAVCLVLSNGYAIVTHELSGALRSKRHYTTARSLPASFLHKKHKHLAYSGLEPRSSAFEEQGTYREPLIAIL